MRKNNKCCESLKPLNMKLFLQPNLYENVVACIMRTKQLEIEREGTNRKKLDEWNTYLNNSYNNGQKCADILPQIKISLYFEKLPKVTNIALEEFCDHKFSIMNKCDEEQ